MISKLYYLILFIMTTFSLSPIFPDDWKDLEEGEIKEVYGSEKSKKYSMSNIFGEIEKWDNHYGVRILYLYDYTDYPKYNSTQFFPFYYRINSKIDNREKFRFLNYTSKQEKEQTDKSVLPLIYWGGNTKYNHNYHAAFPFYSYSITQNDALENKNLILFPATYYYTYQSISSESFTRESHFSILHGRTLEKYKSTNKNRESSIWFPIIPLIRYTTLEDSYFHYTIPVYGYYRKETAQEEQLKFGFSLFPFFYSRSSYPIADKNRHYDITHWTLFHYRSVEEDTGGFKEYTHKSKWGFPVIPFLFYSSFEQGDGNYKRILTLFHWASSEKGELDSFSFLPFVFYKKKDYFRIPILFIDKDLSAPSSSYGRSFMPLFLYYNRWDPSSQTFVLGPWVSLTNDAKKESTKTLFPFYFQSKSEKKEITLILPLYVNYNDKESDYNFNLLYFTRSSSGVVNPSLSLGKKENKWYFDTDFTVLYYLASFSFRQTIEKPKFLRNVLERNKSFEELEEDKKKELALAKNSKAKNTDNTPKLTRKKSVTRDESLSFSGYSLLFGVLSYEAADSRRHFRLLPLSWLSWDKESSDKVLVAPLFLWYQSDLLEYFVFFPFYGKQKDETSEKKAVLLNAYIQETYKENNWKETSVAWPLVNWFSSDTKSGHRVLPFYIQQNYKTKDSESNYNYTLFSYFQKTKTNDTLNTNFLLWPGLTYYESFNRKDLNTDGGVTEYNSSTLWVTPFFYRGKDTSSSHTNFLWLFDLKYRGDKLDRVIAFPFFYFSDGFFGIFPISFTNKGSNFWTFTLFNYLNISENTFYYNFLFLAEAEKNPNLLELNLFLKSIQYANTKESSNFHGLWGYGWNFSRDKGKWEEASILSYLGGGYRKDGLNSIYNLSLLFYHNSSPDSYQNWTLGNYRRVSKEGIRNNFLYLADYEYFASDNTYTWDFLFTGIRYHNLKTESYFQGAYGFAWNFKKENDIWKDATFLWLGYSRRNEETVYNFLPIIRTYDYKEEHSRIYGPLLLYTSEEEGKKLHLGLLGLGYWYSKDERNKEEDTYILLGTLYREYTERERGFRARGSLWGWLWDYQKEEETSFEKYSVLKLFSYTKEADGTKKILGISF